jgi:cellulase
MSCYQVNVKGTGTQALPKGVRFPGAYKSTDPGILVDIYQSQGSYGKKKYVAPGPAVWNGAEVTTPVVTSPEVPEVVAPKAPEQHAPVVPKAPEMPASVAPKAPSMPAPAQPKTPAIPAPEKPKTPAIPAKPTKPKSAPRPKTPTWPPAWPKGIPKGFGGVPSDK